MPEAPLTAKIHVGMSGWTYAPWRGTFYPKGLSQKKELEYAAKQVSSIEVNGTFYSLQKPATFRTWNEQTPPDFRFALKAPQFMTHVLRLKEPEEPLATFLASGVFELGPKLGPILWQLPPNVMLKDDRFEKFFKMLPHDSLKAAELSRGHSSRIEGRACTEAQGKYPIRHAFEFRHPSFRNAGFIDVMRGMGVGVVIADSSRKTPVIEDVTADFVYVRMHGEDEKYAKGYTPAALKRWAKRLRAWRDGSQPDDADCVSQDRPKKKARDVFVYFSTDEKEYSPFDALNLLEELNK